MEEYLIVYGSLLAHHGGSYLAQSHAMAPTGTVEDEARGQAVRRALRLDNEGGTEKVGGAECTAYLQFLANDKCAFLTLYPQTADAPTAPTLQGNEGFDAAKVHLQLLTHQDD